MQPAPDVLRKADIDVVRQCRSRARAAGHGWKEAACEQEKGLEQEESCAQNKAGKEEESEQEKGKEEKDQEEKDDKGRETRIGQEAIQGEKSKEDQENEKEAVAATSRSGRHRPSAPSRCSSSPRPRQARESGTGARVA